jgi:hypothetical protein
MICKYIVLVLATYLWLVYLTWELTYYRRDSTYKPRWWEKDLFQLGVDKRNQPVKMDALETRRENDE